MKNNKYSYAYELYKFFGGLGIGIGIPMIGFLCASKLDKALFPNTKFEYYRSEDGTYHATSEVKYDVVKTYYLVERVNELGEKELCITNKYGTNMMNNEFIGDINIADHTPFSTDEFILNVENLEPYLEQFEIKELYTPDDLKNMINVISENYNWHDGKVLTIQYK